MADVDFLRARPYKDLSLTLARNPVTNDVVTVEGDEAVKRSIKNLLMTVAGEVPFYPNFGSALSRLLFEPIDPVTTTLLASEVRATIEGFEPRVIIQSLDVTPTPDENRYQLDLVIQIVNLPQPITLTLFLTRLR
jgi:phage baseplate assembly protein W